MDHANSSTTQKLTFGVGGERFALNAQIVREVTLMPALSRVPHAPPMLLGLANVRGSVIPVLSMACLLDRDGQTPSRLIVVDAGEHLGLAVDDAKQVVDSEQVGSLREIDVEQLVARHRPAAVARRSCGSVALPMATGEAEVNATPLLAFAIGNQEFAMPLAAVDEVVRMPDGIAAMPEADDAVIGSAAVRGAVLPLLSLRALLALPDGGMSARSRVVVVRIGTHRVGLLVDEMRSILRVRETMIDAVPLVLARGSSEAKIQAICRLDDGERLISVLAADHLLREDITARLLLNGTTEGDDMSQDEAEPATTEQFLLFRIASEEFAIPIAAVEEVTQLPAKLTPLPKAPAFVKGVMNLSGRVIPVIDQAQRFGTAASETARPRVIVVKIDDVQAGFIVDAVTEVVRVDASALQPAPTLGNEKTRVFERVANLPGKQRIVLIVSPRELLDRAEQDLLRKLRSAPKATGGAKTAL